MIGRLLTSCVVLAALAGCTSAREQELNRRAAAAERTLQRMPTIGDPGRVAAADLASARLALSEGMAEGFGRYAAAGALVHTQIGPIPDVELVPDTEPADSDSRSPNTIWTSCDGTLAVTFGRFSTPEGYLGTYARAWELQGDRSYKWTYDLGALDNPQPAPEPGEELPEGAIIVPGMTAINGMVSDCPAGDGNPLPELAVPIMPYMESGGAVSADGTLLWRWFHAPNGQRTFMVRWVREGEVQDAVMFEAPNPPFPG